MYTQKPFPCSNEQGITTEYVEVQDFVREGNFATNSKGPIYIYNTGSKYHLHAGPATQVRLAREGAS